MGTLQHYFPGWHIHAAHFADEEIRHGERKRSDDRTTFLEVFDRDNTTTVFVVRGTLTAFDLLYDINIWSPAFIMQIFSLLGPNIERTMATTVSDLSARRYLGTLFGHTIST